MNKELSGSKQALFIAALLLSTIIVDGELIIIPITYNFYEAFAGQQAAVNFIISAPMLLMIFVSLLVPYIVRLIGKKPTILTGCILFTLSGVMGLRIPSIPYIIAWRIVNAISQGLVGVSAMMYISETFTDSNKRASITGFYTTAMSLIAMILSALSGFLASQRWTNSFNLYWLGLPVILMVIFFVPNSKKEDSSEETVSAKNTVDKQKTSMGIHFYIFIFVLLAFYISYCVPVYFASVYIAEHQLGNETFAGIATSVSNVASMLSGLLFGKISAAKNKTAVFAFIVLAVGISLMYFFHTKAMELVACFIIGSTMALIYSFSFSQLPNIVPADKIDRAVSIVQAISGAGQFIATYFVTWLMGGVFKTDLVTPVLIVPIIIMIVMAVVEFFNSSGIRVQSQESNVKSQ
jgi:MFS family permease